MSNQMPSIVAHYRYSVVWSPEDEEFLATVAEFPSLSWMEADQIEALQGLENLVREVVHDMSASGEAVPQPFAERKYSGNLKVRVSPETHRNLAIAANEQGVSLNRFLSERLAGR
ncbi:type II toxin-antitoxin system HicB family antitoxin [Zafaria sp. Z1313]|uniref:type II toxin-antitoxin system HicB family antitoxin n=1 Tax=unclassified Zafaria TaxID=2828765 RepID=UPI002E78A45C|nr:toxin-antitoxin system HicB family antitoxin [Zafaria sp. J156]MEE1620486.1 toxin-antitoxin system HicB family antitoxin [Zafaria sp. J156]